MKEPYQGEAEIQDKEKDIPGKAAKKAVRKSSNFITNIPSVIAPLHPLFFNLLNKNKRMHRTKSTPMFHNTAFTYIYSF